MIKKFFTSESVTEGHPDKICDQISDAVLDAILAKDPNARVACETATTTGMILVMGEITTSTYVDIPTIARETIREIGYDSSEKGFDCDTCAVLTAIHEQSPDIALGVDKSLEAKEGALADQYDTGAGDQGMVFGYACNETPELMPLPISLAQKLAKKLTEVRKSGVLPYLRADGKTQVTVEYHDDKPVRIDSVVISSQHSDAVTLEQIREDVIREVVTPTLPALYMDDDTKIYVNPTGRFVVGGPKGDSGLTGRSSSIPTAATPATAAAPSAARTRPRLTAAPRIWRAMRPRTSSPRVWPRSAKSKSPTPSASRARFRCSSTPSAPARPPTTPSPAPSARSSTCVRPLSSRSSTSAARSIRRSPLTATSAARNWA